MIGFKQIEFFDHTGNTYAESFGPAYDLPKIWAYNNYQYTGNLTWIKGKHSLKFGGEFLRIQYFSKQYGDTRGRLTFLGRNTGEPMADLLLGWPSSTRRQLDAGGPYHLVSNYDAYAQDDYKVSANLTLNLGIRYELMKTPREKYGAWSMFVPELGKQVIAGYGNLSQAEFDQRIASSGIGPLTVMAKDAGLPATIASAQREPLFVWLYRERLATLWDCGIPLHLTRAGPALGNKLRALKTDCPAGGTARSHRIGRLADVILLDQAAKHAAVLTGRLGRMSHVTAMLFQRALHERPLEIGDRARTAFAEAGCALPVRGIRDAECDVAPMDGVAVAQYRGSLDHVGQFPHVARPLIGCQIVQGARRDSLLAQGWRRQLFEKVVGKCREIA
jgi:hypothetical protein